MISVIIVSFKVPELLLRCVSALAKSQTPPELEIIIVDNNSQDNGRELVTSQFQAIKWIQNERNLGFAAAVNIGIQASTGDLIVLVNPDTVIHTEALQIISAFVKSKPDLGIAGGKIINTDGTFQKQCVRRFPRPASAFFRLFKLNKLLPHHRLSSAYEMQGADIDQPTEIDACSGAFLAFPKSLVKRIGMFDEGYFLMGEDLDYCFRAKQAGFSVWYIPAAEMLHHHGASRKTRPLRSIYYGHYAMLRYFRKFIRNDYSMTARWMIYAGITGRFLAQCMISLTGRLARG